MPEKKLRCQDCGKEFTFFEDEQRWFLSKGYAIPKRCKACRIARREQREKKTSKPDAPRSPAQQSRQ